MASPTAANIPIIQGVRVNCIGDVELRRRPEYESVQVPASDFPDKEARDIPTTFKIGWMQPTAHLVAGLDLINVPIASRIGIPLLAKPVAPDASFQNKYILDMSAICNTHGMVLMPIGELSPAFYTATGSFVVVRKDGKPLEPMHMEAIAHYGVDKVMRGKDGMKDASEEDFKIWYSEWIKGAEEEKVQGIRSPFDV